MLGYVLEIIRICNRLSRNTVERLTGIPATTLLEIESLRRGVSLLTLEKLSEAYNMPINQIFYFKKLQHQLNLDFKSLKDEILIYYRSNYNESIKSSDEDSFGKKIRLIRKK